MSFWGHPFHPMTSHFPVAFYVLGVGLTVAYLWRGQTDLGRFALWSFSLSWLATLLASLVGLIDQGQLPPTDPRRVYINNHITAGVTLIIINGLLLYLHLRWPDVLTRYRWPYLGLMILGLITVLAAAWLGGELVYRWHIGIIE